MFEVITQPVNLWMVMKINALTIKVTICNTLSIYNPIATTILVGTSSKYWYVKYPLYVNDCGKSHHLRIMSFALYHFEFRLFYWFFYNLFVLQICEFNLHLDFFFYSNGVVRLSFCWFRLGFVLINMLHATNVISSTWNFLVATIASTQSPFLL